VLFRSIPAWINEEVVRCLMMLIAREAPSAMLKLARAWNVWEKNDAGTDCR